MAGERIDPLDANQRLIQVTTRPLAPIGGAGRVQTPTVAGPSFQQVFQRELGQIKFSAHAQQRLALRDGLTETELRRLNDGVDKAAEKGARESLILLDNLALIVSVKNRTVITAVDGQRMKENVFTNIDSAVIV